MQLRDTLNLRFNRNTLLVAALSVWVISVVAGAAILAPDLSENQFTVVILVLCASPVVAAIVIGHLRRPKAPAPIAVAHPQIPDPPDTPKLKSATSSLEQQPTDSFAGELERLAELHARGALNDDQFEAAKARLLSTS